MIDRDELPDSAEIMASCVAESIQDAMDYADTEQAFVAKTRALADAAATAFRFAAESLDVSCAEESYAKALFLHIMEVSPEDFRVVHGDDALIPGAVEDSFIALDEWFSKIGKDKMPKRAAELLELHGKDVDDELREHWESLASKQEK